MSLRDNIRLIREVAGLTRGEFGKAIGVSEDNVYTYEKRGTEPKPLILKRIAKFGNVTTDDLKDRELSESDIKIYSNKHNNADKPYEDPIEVTYKEPEPRYKKRVPLFDAQAIAGNDYVADLAPVIAPSQYVELGDILRNDSQAAMYVYGNSMNPSYPSGCIIGLRLNRDGIIVPGEVYVIETLSNRHFKRLYYNEDKTGYTCYSDNIMSYETGPRKGKLFYEPFDILFDQVQRLFDVTGMIKRNQNSAITMQLG